MLGYENPSRDTKNAFAGHLCPAGHRLDQTVLTQCQSEHDPNLRIICLIGRRTVFCAPKRLILSTQGENQSDMYLYTDNYR